MSRDGVQLSLWPAASARACEPPTQRLWRCGASALNDAELVSLLLRPEDRGACPGLAQRVLGEEGLSRLTQWDEKSVLRCGLGERGAPLLLAVELARRLVRSQLPEGALLPHRHRVVEYLWMRYQGEDQEVMGALYLDAHQRLIALKELFRGPLDRLAVEPRPILRHALAYHAKSFVLFHNHPSGDPTPSSEDVAFTRQLHKAARIFGVPLEDHLVVGSGDRFVSIQPSGTWRDARMIRPSGEGRRYPSQIPNTNCPGKEAGRKETPPC